MTITTRDQDTFSVTVTGSSTTTNTVTISDKTHSKLTDGKISKHILLKKSFETLLSYKLDERGGPLWKVSAHFTSQTSSECGAVDRKSRENQATFCLSTLRPPYERRPQGCYKYLAPEHDVYARGGMGLPVL